MTQDEFSVWFLHDVIDKLYRAVWTIEESKHYDLRITGITREDDYFEHFVGNSNGYNFAGFLVGADYRLRGQAIQDIPFINHRANITFETYRDYCQLEGEDETLARLKW